MRWDQTRKDREAAGEDAAGSSENLPAGAIAGGSGRGLPPGLPPRASGPPGSRPPPPPSRTSHGAGPPPVNSSSKPSLPSRTAGSAPPPPGLPPRMANENGIDNPPPPYVGAKPGLPSRGPVPGAGGSSAGSRSVPSAPGPGYLEFSKFDQAEKQAFFQLLDQYFASRDRDVTLAP